MHTRIEGDGKPEVRQAKLWYRLVPASIYIRLRTHRARAKSGRRGDRELRLLPLLVPRDRVAVDIGANRGVYTCFLAKLAPRVIAYEPVPSMAAFIESAGLPKVEVRCAAASNESGSQVFSIPIDAKGRRQFNGARLGRLDSPCEIVEVRKVRLDDEDLGDVGFMKIDVEGHEPAVIDGARETILRHRPLLQVEVLELSRQAHSDTVTLIEKLDYSPYFFTGTTLIPLARAKVDLLGRNVLFFPR